MSLLDKNCSIKVSSVHERDIKNYGKQHLTDGNLETCWNSSQNSPQSILIQFPNPIIPAKLLLMFQGGFAGNDCEMVSSLNGIDRTTVFKPKDSNEMQEFPMNVGAIDKLRIIFKNSTDFYGRITVYNLDIQ